MNLKTIPISKPFLGAQEAEAASRVITSGWVTQGPEVEAFEKEFATYVGAPYACAVSNCTTALFLALRAAGISTGDEVITVSHSFIATANSIRSTGAIPVFVDIEKNTLNLDPQRVEALITPKTKAILCVHQLGFPCDLTKLVEISKRRHLVLIEDAACAIGSEISLNGNWEKIGKPHGDIACFSFHPRKLLTTGDGGMLTTRNADLDAKFRLLRQHSMSVSDRVRHESSKPIFESYTELGYNFRLTDIQAAIGREQLRKVPSMIQERERQAAFYQDVLSGTGCTLPEVPSWAKPNWQSFCIILPETLDQSSVMQFMQDRGVSTRRGVMNAHSEPAYQIEPWRGEGLPLSERARDLGILLPLYNGLSGEDQKRVAQVLREALKSPLCVKDIK